MANYNHENYPRYWSNRLHWPSPLPHLHRQGWQITAAVRIVIHLAARAHIINDTMPNNCLRLGNLTIAGSQWQLSDGTSLETLQEIIQVIEKWLGEALEDLENLIVLEKLERMA